VNVGIVGAGRQGWRRARALELFPDDRLVAVADRDAEAAHRLADAYNAATHDDWLALVARPDVDAVLVCTPPDSHAEIAIAALERGRHVLVEKPLARSAAEAEPIVTAARAALERGVVCAVGFNYRHHPAIQQARRWVDEGAIGELLYARMRHGIVGRQGYAADWRASAAVSGGGELLDQGIHLLDLARWFFGDFSEVRAMLTTSYWPIAPVEDNAFVLLRTAAGQVVQLHASWTEWRNLFSVELFGRDGYVRVEGLGGSYGVETAALGRRNFDAPFSERVIEYRGEDSSWRSEWEAFRGAVLESSSPEAGASEGLAAIALVAAIYEAADGTRRQSPTWELASP
jgi:predicted dehydrogenase